MKPAGTPLNSIEQKLDAYILKRYEQLFWKGLLRWSLASVAGFLVLAYWEHWQWMSSTWRTLFWYAGLSLLLLSALVWWARPYAQSRAWLARMSREQAAAEIGNFYPEVQDKLLNLLQLRETAGASEWLEAAIEQRSLAMGSVSFWEVLNPAAFRKWAWRLGLACLMLGLWFVLDSARLAESAARIWKYNQAFQRPAPFEFVFHSPDKSLVAGQSYTVELSLKGQQIPTSVRCRWMGQERLMRTAGPDSFVLDIGPLSASSELVFVAGEFESEAHWLEVWSPPSLASAQLKVQYPVYWKGERQSDWPAQGVVFVPQGSQLSLQVEGKQAQQLWIKGQSLSLLNGRAVYTHTALESQQWSYCVKGRSANGKMRQSSDTLLLDIRVIQDAAPLVQLESEADPSQSGLWYLRAWASDDQAITKLGLWVKGPRDADFKPWPMKTEYRDQAAALLGALAASEFQLAPGEEIQCMARACDNNSVRGKQCAQSPVLVLRLPEVEELKAWQLEKQAQVESGLSSASQAQRDLQKRSADLQRSLMQESGMDADKRQSVQQWLNEQKNLQTQTQKLAEQQRKLEIQGATESQKTEARKKQVEESLNALKQNAELEKLMKELQELLNQKADSDQVRQKMQEISRMRQDIQKQLQNVQEQIKELQLERMVEQQLDAMQAWAKEEERLAEQSQKASTLQEKQALEEAHQQQLNALEQIQQRSEEIEQRDADLEKPLGLETPKQEQSSAEQKAQSAQKQLEKGQSKSASEQQQSAAEDMKKAAQKLQSSMESAQEERMKEDYESLRRLLANLIDLSKRQESIFTELQTLSSENPRALALNQQQMEVKELSASVEDSLMALSRRQPMIGSFVTAEMSKLNRRMEQGLLALKKRDLRTAAMHEQFVMSSYNTLAAMLMESMQNMQQEMSSQQKKSGSQSCSNPNKQGPGQQGKPKPGQGLSQSQKALGEKLKQMQSQGQQGQSGSQGQRQLSQELGQMALMQEQLRREIQRLKQAAAESGDPGSAQLLHEAEQLMEQQERDIINGNLGSQLQFRQQQILTRLLEHERGERKQQQDEQRRGEQSRQQPVEIPEEWALPLKKKLDEIEALQRSVLPLSWPYQQALDQYLNRQP